MINLYNGILCSGTKEWGGSSDTKVSELSWKKIGGACICNYPLVFIDDEPSGWLIPNLSKKT